MSLQKETRETFASILPLQTTEFSVTNHIGLPYRSLLRTEAEVSAEECPWERAEARPSLEGQFFCPLVLRPTVS